MARKRIDKILKTPSWPELRQTFSRHLPVQFPLQAASVIPGGFGELFEKDFHWGRQDWKNQALLPDIFRGSWIGLLLTVPIIWSVAIPLALLDLMATLYQIICFPVYGISIVKRSEFIVIDRHKLAYLNGLEKLNCVYCGYGNGVLAYVREIASRTEERWCPIKHMKSPAHPHSRYENFANFGDQEAYCRKVEERKRFEERRP
ncbi:MAG: hypothetical protein HQL78_12625 [Magnetococcales bacterium]|nr:hypothetical protein [Magnetococcales bacterium]